MKDLKLLSPTQVSELLDKAPQTLQNWRYQGIGPKFVKIGRNVKYRESDLLDWLDKNTYTETGQRRKKQ